MRRVASMALGWAWQATWALACLMTPAVALAQGAAKPAAKKTPTTEAAKGTGTLARIRETGTIKLGYRTDARPFSFDSAGGPVGYSVDLCQRVPDAVKQELGLSSLKVEWVPVTVEDRISAVQEHRVDLLCGSTSVTLGRRKEVDFSVPIFPGGVGVV